MEEQNDPGRLFQSADALFRLIARMGRPAMNGDHIFAGSLPSGFQIACLALAGLQTQSCRTLPGLFLNKGLGSAAAYLFIGIAQQAKPFLQRQLQLLADLHSPDGRHQSGLHIISSRAIEHIPLLPERQSVFVPHGIKMGQH